MSLFPSDNKARKGLPVFKQLLYFPKALREVTKVSVVNNVRYNPDRDPFDITWNRGKSTDQLGSGFRHMLESAVDGTVFEEVPADVAEKTGITHIYVLAEAAWRALAALEDAIDKQEALDALAEAEDKYNMVTPPWNGAMTPAAGREVFITFEPHSQTLPVRPSSKHCWRDIRAGEYAMSSENLDWDSHVRCKHGFGMYRNWAWVGDDDGEHHPSICGPYEP